MLYSFVEMQRASLMPFRALNAINNYWLKAPINPFANTPMGRNLLAASDVFEALTRRYGRPEWNLEDQIIAGEKISFKPNTIWRSSWCHLTRFEPSKPLKPNLPKVLIVAPLSGHFATLLRGTVEAFVEDHEVYITEWIDAKNVPLTEGRFDLDDYIDHVREMISFIGKDVHVIAVCQPGPPVLACIALMSEDKDPNTPKSMCFMGSPIDARKSPTVTNDLAQQRPFTWFKSNMIFTVPLPNAGALRRVYPGFVQLYSFMSMNQDNHIDAHKKYFDSLVEGDGESAQKHRKFYDEYLSVLDLT